MVIEDGKFYFIKDEFFDVFKEYGLMVNKENENKKQKYPKNPVYNFVFGEVLGKKAVFLIQNIFPTTEKYIENKYMNSNMDVKIPTKEQKNVIVTSLRVVGLAEQGFSIPFYNIMKMRNVLLEGKE